jgi:lipopolysaccharide/colanic/teichoic acid biosynthesis glycosyltransferase
VTKRVLDVVIAALSLLLLAPLLVGVALLIKLDSTGPVFFRQERIGRHGVPFRIFKFRTMAHRQATDSPALTIGHDPRITRMGAYLRRRKIDELAQLIDVLRGSMSLVGPRPEVARYVAHYPDAIRREVLSVRPGITDLASLHYRDESALLAQASDPEHTYLHTILPAKLQYALDYVRTQSTAGDLRIMGLTLKLLLWN